MKRFVVAFDTWDEKDNPHTIYEEEFDAENRKEAERYVAVLARQFLDYEHITSDLAELYDYDD